MPRNPRRVITRAAIAMAAAVGIVFVQAAPASATVHEIVGQWCSGQGELAPRGISGGSNADNFARPLVATGVVTGDVVPFTGEAGPGVLIEFNYDLPNVKVVPTGEYVVVAPGPVYLELIAPSSDFAAFKHCPRLVDHD